MCSFYYSFYNHCLGPGATEMTGTGPIGAGVQEGKVDCKVVQETYEENLEVKRDFSMKKKYIKVQFPGHGPEVNFYV